MSSSGRSRSRRMSLGGGAQRRVVLGDKSTFVNNSNNNNNNNGNPVFDGGSGGPAGATPSKHSRYGLGGGTGSSGSILSKQHRRQSFGGESLQSSASASMTTSGGGGGTGGASSSGLSILEKYRQRQAAAVAAASVHNGNNTMDDDQASTSTFHTIDSRKRVRGDGPPLPPSSTNKFLKSSATKDTQVSSSILLYDDEYDNEGIVNNNNADESFHHHPHSHRGAHHQPHVSSQTPISKKSRRATMGGASGRVASVSSRRKSLLGRNVYHPEDLSQQEEPLSQLTQDLDVLDPDISQSNVSHVEGAGLQSQMERMTQRVEQLEKEKMELSMAKAPLEARFRQREDMWEKEKASLIDQIEASKASLRESDEKYRDLLAQYEQTFEEVSHLRLEVRKASSTARVVTQNGNAVSCSTSSGTNNGLWNRQLQNDRDLAETKEKLRGAEEEISAIRLAKVSLEKELHATRIELTCLERNYDELRAEYDEIAAQTSENNEAEIKLQVLTEEHIATTAALNAVYADLDATKARADAKMKEMEDQHKKEIEQLQFDLSVVKTRANKMQVDLDTSRDLTDGDIEDEAVLRARIEDRDKRILKLEADLLKGEQLRRQMHNTIQELRGNIRVYVRTRPFLPGDKQNDESPIDVTPDGESLAILDRRSGAPMDFKFDKVFSPSAGQELVFDEVSDFVQSALDGYHVCLFSYGQTGSGKTHTMQGCGNGPMRGIIPRAVEKILDQARALNQHKWKFTVTASFLEIYNENLKDLLTSMVSEKGRGKGDSRAGKSNDKLSIKRNREGKSFVDGLTHIPIDVNESTVGMEQLQALMAVASRSRSVASTKMNSQSSRSHSVFMLHLNGFNDETGAIVNGALNLCDLAGSERLDRSGAGADAKRLKETQSINKSLSCLGDVFNALATGASHVPYRNSKLTYLLQDCLSGDGKALMFVNLSPTTASCGESVCSLRFAQRVNQVELGKATKHIEYSRK